MLEILRKINEWWETGSIPKELAPSTRREVFGEIAEFLEDRRILALIGPRRTGKTTLMYQIMDLLVREKGVEPGSVLFFSCDDVELRGTENLLGEAVRTYFEEFLKRDYRAAKAYVFIDEIHWVRDWQLWLKKFYDLKYGIKFIISGSSAAKIKRDQKESLAGRIAEFAVFPMGFPEFLRFSGMETAEKIPLKQMTYGRMRELREKIGPRQALETKRLLDEYLLAGGLPEWFETKNVRKWHRKLREDVIKRVVYDDIATLYGVKNPIKIEELLRLLSSLQSRIYSYNSIAATLRMDNETAERYVGYLKESFLVFELLNYAASREKQLRKNYKYVLFDSGVRNALELISSLREADIGYIVEGAVQQHLLWNLEKGAMEVFYWREKEEVDIVIKEGSLLLPIEVKYQPKISANGIVGLVKFMDAQKLLWGMVLTKDSLELKNIDGREILLVPVWLFLLAY